MSDNWVVQNLENALETWNEKLSEIWTLITTTPQNFKGGNIWKVIVDINGAVQAIGLALLVLFFVIGMVKTCGSFTDVKKPEHALKLFVRFALAKGYVEKSIVITPNTWFHLAFRFNDRTVTVFKNGEQLHSGSVNITTTKWGSRPYFS